MPWAQFRSVYNKEAFTDDVEPFTVNREQVINFAFNLIYNWTGAKFLYNLQIGLVSLKAFWMALCKPRGWCSNNKSESHSGIRALPWPPRRVSWQRTGTQLQLINCTTQILQRQHVLYVCWVCVCVWPVGAGYSWKTTDGRHAKCKMC